MEDINEELKLLRQHYNVLEEQLAELDIDQKPYVHTRIHFSCKSAF